MLLTNRLRLDSLELSNYRKFETYEVEFDSRLTVLTGDNASGKSTLLDAASVALGTYLTRFDHSKGVGIVSSDARCIYVRQGSTMDRQSIYPVRISAKGLVGGCLDDLDAGAEWGDIENNPQRGADCARSE